MLKKKPNLKAKMNILAKVNQNDVDASKWWLERKSKDEFSTKQERDTKVKYENAISEDELEME